MIALSQIVCGVCQWKNWKIDQYSAKLWSKARLHVFYGPRCIYVGQIMLKNQKIVCNRKMHSAQ